MRNLRAALVTGALWIAAPLCLALAVSGAVRGYSTVPFWDMWPATLEFVLRIEEGRWSEWWALHNEHRIVLARALFWLDYALFDGTSVFLLVVNFLLAFGAWLTWRAILLERAPQAQPRLHRLFGLFMFACLFSWIQWENLGWAFQSQFFLAQWLPLLALWLLYRSTRPGPEADRTFALACVVGVACIGTMASGVIALPLMVAYALLLRMDRRRVVLLAALGALCLVVYFTGFRSTEGHGSLRDVLRHQPLQLAQYVLLYIGGPFYHLSGGDHIEAGQAAGLVFVVLAAAQALRCLRAPRAHALELCVLTFILYIGGTALGTGAGRLLFGLHQATASRYSTPALMAWMGLLVLYAPVLMPQLEAWRHRIVWPLIAILAALLTWQKHGADSQRHVIFEREAAAVALALGVRDRPQLLQTVFSPEIGIYVANHAVPLDAGVFQQPWLRGVRRTLGQPVQPPAPATACRGALMSVENIETERGWLRVVGWLASPDDTIHRKRNAPLRILDASGRRIGHALVGEALKGVNTSRDGLQGTRGFKGYVQVPAAYGTMVFAYDGGRCALRPPVIPAPPFSFVPYAEALRSVNVTPAQIAVNDGWNGDDFQHTRTRGYRIVGSRQHGDADTGRIMLQLRRGDALFLRTGPSTAMQRYRIGDGSRFAGTLPVAQEWVAVSFDHPDLPAAFTLTLEDGGGGWGEWSAISLREP